MGDQEVRDLSTQAPTIGRVMPLVGAATREGQPPRRPEVALDAAASDGVRAAGASLAGVRHLSEGTCRQDSFGIFVVQPGRICVVVVDGLGSRVASHLGADLFVDAVGQLTWENQGLAAPADLLVAASERTEQVAASVYGLSASDIAFVGLVAVIGPDQGEVARLGDVSAFALAGDEFTEVFEPDDKFINVVEVSLPNAEAAHQIEVKALPPGPMVFATDGLAQDLRTSAAVRAWLADYWRSPLTAFAMGDSLRYRRQGSHDDRTGVVVWPST